MIPAKNERYPNTAKAILALFIISIVMGHSMLRSADKRTRAHFTARDGRSTAEGKNAPALTTLADQALEAAKKNREYEARIRAELEKRIQAEERLAQKELEKRIGEEERQARKELQERLDEMERAAEIARKVRLDGESTDREKAKPWYNPIGWRSPFASKNSKASNKVLEDEIRKRAEMGKRLAAKELSARKEMEKRIEEEERQSLKELKKRIEEEERQSLKELKKRLEEEERLAVIARKNQLEGGVTAPRNANPWYHPAGWRLAFEKKNKGYLAYNEPAPLRFSNEYLLRDQSLSASLPEFTMMTPGQEPLIVETRLSEKEIHRKDLLRQVVVNMNAHTIVSGRIDTSIPRSRTEGPRFDLEERLDAVVRAEEVLIFFENQRGEGGGRTIVPFSPALPTQQSPVHSRANYRIEK
jgi:hypothetical protein